ncbi:hypothetical protein EDD16DRAFT_1831134, partial [Pisolithus croceorrhizus]
ICTSNSCGQSQVLSTRRRRSGARESWHQVSTERLARSRTNRTVTFIPLVHSQSRSSPCHRADFFFVRVILLRYTWRPICCPCCLVWSLTASIAGSGSPPPPRSACIHTLVRFAIRSLCPR